MSTKIYTAYKIPLNKTKEFCKEFFSQCRKQTEEKLALTIDSYSSQKFTDWFIEKHGNNNEMKQEQITREFIEWLWQVAYKPAAESNLNSYYNISYGLWAYPLGRSLYIIPDTPKQLWFDLLSVDTDGMKYVKDFSYWNNTDRPDNVLSKEWSHRKRTWEKIFKESVPMYITGFNAREHGEFFNIVAGIIFDNYITEI